MYSFMARPQTGHSVLAEHSFHSFLNSKSHLTGDRNSDSTSRIVSPSNPPKQISTCFALFASLAITLSLLGTTGCGVNVRGASTAAAQSGTLVATPATIDFGNVGDGESADQKLTLANTGSDPVQITALEVSNSAFGLDGQRTFPLTLAAGSTLSFNVHFSPNDTTDVSGQLNVSATSSKVASLSSRVELHGRGIKHGALADLSCANASMSGAGSDTCTVTLSSPANGNSVEVGLESSSHDIKVPASVTVAKGSTTANFVASVSNVTAPEDVTLTAQHGSESKSTSIKLGSAAAPAAASISALACGSTSITGQMADSCTVSLSGSAPSGGFSVALSSSSSSVKVPGSVMVPATASSATFTANVASVTAAQSVTLTATAGNASKTVSLKLGTASAALSVDSTSIAFGSTSLNTPTSQSLKLTAAGSANVTVKSAAITGTGFTVSGQTFPLTLTPGQSASLELQFDPTSAGAATGQLTITSDSQSNPTTVVALSGTGSSHKVTLSWDAPNGGNDIAGYNVYREGGSATAYSRLNSNPDSNTTYTDASVQSGQTYEYVVKTVDASGHESSPSNATTVTIP